MGEQGTYSGTSMIEVGEAGLAISSGSGRGHSSSPYNDGPIVTPSCILEYKLRNMELNAPSSHPSSILSPV